MSAEIQQAPESTLSVDLMAWFEENKRRLLAGLFIAVVAIAVTIVYRNYKASVEESASKSLVMLLASQTNGLPSGDQLLQIARTTTGTKASERALFLAGVKQFEDGKYAEAQTQLEALLNSNPNGPLAAQAALGVAAALDGQNKVADALSAYSRFAATFPGDSLVPQAKLAQGRILESQGKNQEALAIYRDLTKVNSGYAREAVARQAYLLQQHPELIPPPQSVTNSVKVSAPPTGGALQVPASAPAGAPQGK